MPSYSIALIDFRSLLGGPTSDAACREAVELAAELARSVIVPSHLRGSEHDLRCRVYGGFRDQGGNPTPEYLGLLSHVGALQGLDRNVRTFADFALNILRLPSDDLVGKYRGGEQKMVDTNLAVDAVALAGTGYATLTVVSNDDDFTPVLLAIARAPGMVQWLRRRRKTRNDGILQREGVLLLSDPAWP